MRKKHRIVYACQMIMNRWCIPYRRLWIHPYHEFIFKICQHVQKMERKDKGAANMKGNLFCKLIFCNCLHRWLTAVRGPSASSCGTGSLTSSPRPCHGWSFHVQQTLLLLKNGTHDLLIMPVPSVASGEPRRRSNRRICSSQVLCFFWTWTEFSVRSKQHVL